MWSSFCIIILLVSNLVASTTSSQGDGSSGSSDSNHHESTSRHRDGTAGSTWKGDCGIWLAPSTIPGAGLGMFAGVDFVEGQDILPGGDSVIAISDLRQHNSNKAMTTTTGTRRRLSFLWDEYTWNGKGQKMETEGRQEVHVASEGFGAAVNCFLDLTNVYEWYPRLVDLGGMHRRHNPGAGASTYHHVRRTTAKVNVSAGSEFFANYGEKYFWDRPELGPIPLKGDLERGTRLMQKYSQLQAKLVARSGSFARDNVTAAADADVASVIARDVWQTFVNGTKFVDSRVLQGAFRHHDPNDVSHIQDVHNNNVTNARRAASRRSLDWLQQHGTCGDHIVGRPSTLSPPNAGMGAFATRLLPVETVVALLPLIHIPHRSRLEMYTLHYSKATQQWAPTRDKNVMGHQLLLNYCLGHGESTLLLCPYGPMVNYVNHNQTLANVRLQWVQGASGGSIHRPELLNQSIEEIETSDDTAKLAMELVAIRDIQEGEEIFLDYGHEWEAAWHAHVSNWQPMPGASTYVSAAQLEVDKTSRLKSVYEELDHKTYPDNVQLMCDTACLMEPSAVQEHYRNGTLDEYLWRHNSAWWPCAVLHSRLDDNSDGHYLYTIHMYQDDNGRPANSARIENVPRPVFHFVDKPYTGDVYQQNAFRHDIRIPDSLFPLSWRNVKA